MRLGGLAWVIAAVVGLAAPLGAQEEGPGIPAVVPLAELRLEIAAASFVTELEGDDGPFREARPDTFHGLVVTVRVGKPAGRELTLHPGDLVLHYRRSGGAYDVTPCTGISSFSTRPDAPRTMRFFANGFGRVATDDAGRRAEQLFVDLFFGSMEPDTGELFLLVAQPTGARFATQGWRPGEGPGATGTGLAAVWEDPSDGTRMTIVQEGEGYRVSAAVSVDGESFPLSDPSWDGEVLRWTYTVPSTGYRVAWRTVELRGDELETRWTGTAGGGTEVLRRVADVEPQGPLAGVSLRIVHLERRRGDAEAAAGRLRGQGARVELVVTSDTGNEPHLGRLYALEGSSEEADAVAAEVSDLEELRRVDRAASSGTFDDDQTMILWLVR